MMEKSSTRGPSTKEEHGGGGATSENGAPRSSTPRSKLKDKGLQPGSAERRYKEMLHATSHIYQPQVASSSSDDSLVEQRVSNQSTQTHTKEVLSAREERPCPTGGVLPEGITADVPLNEIMSRDQPTSSAVINSEISPEVPDSIEGKAAKNAVPTEKNAAEQGSLQQKPTENGLVGHGEHFTKDGTTSCRKHSVVYAGSSPKTRISRPKLCDSCTVSMLSYITMLRDMLDVVTNEITNQEDQPVQCPECIKERVLQRNLVRASTPPDHVSQRPHDLPLNKQSQNIGQFSASVPTHLALGASVTNDVQQSDQQTAGQQKRTENLPTGERSDSTQSDAAFRHTQEMPASQHPPQPLRPMQELPASQHPPQPLRPTQEMPASQHLLLKQPTLVHSENGRSQREVDYEGGMNFADSKSDVPAAESTKWGDVLNGQRPPEQRTVGGGSQFDTPRKYREESESRLLDHSGTPDYVSGRNDVYFGGTFSGSGEVHPAAASDQLTWQRESSDDRGPTSSARQVYRSETSPFLRDRDESDGILSTLSNEEREAYDSARGGAGWERLTDSQEYRDTSFGPNSTEAFVTLATTNAEAISCLVLGSSLLLCRTNRTLCVLVTDGVSPSLRAPLASVFQVVQSVRSLDTVGTTKVALLDQPELGIFFRKLHVWRLVQFSKCVFLNPDTLVIQNSDELFCHEELSAVPDIGWPDCFNSGVFVFQPSVETFWKLVEFAESEGSYDGGDQGLLNAFFKTWSKDIHKKLSFIYNLMANVSYTYTPAFKQFGRNVKIVQFQGAFKPWHVKFYSGTGQIAPSTAVHPTYVQFVHVWLNIFRVRVLPLFSQDIQSFASSRNVISASELLKFYPSPTEAEPDFLLTPPSVRLRPDPLRIPKQPTIMRRHSIGSAKELKRDQQPYDSESAKRDRPQEEPQIDRKTSDSLTHDDGDASESKDAESRAAGESPQSPVEEGPPSVEEQLPSAPQEMETGKTDSPEEGAEDDGSRRSSIPGSEIGDYKGMAAWEQGRMDYMGSASSENIIKRLHFLMDKPGDIEKPE